ncbi:hypothetical protein EMCRGX_G017714 [Ephydatia muelleri]
MSEKARFYCPSCKLEFEFKNRYLRHLETARHKAYLQCVKIGEDTSTALLVSPHVQPTDCGSSSPAANGLGSGPVVTEGESCYIHVNDVDDFEGAFESDIIEPPAVVSAEREESASAVDSSLSHLSEADLYKPFASKLLAMAYLIVHSPRPMGQSNLKFILHTLRTSCSAVPSLSRLAKYRLPGYFTPKMHLTSTGIPFYTNSVSNSIKGEFREMYHGLRWRNDKCFFAPMAIAPCGNVFLGDFVDFRISGVTSIGHVLQFVCHEVQDGIYANVHKLEHHPGNIFQYQDGCLVRLTDDEYTTLSSPHPMKAKSIGCGGLPVIMAPISIFSDDTSGNKSKVWNKFNSWNFLLAGLSRKDNAKLHNIHFICASNKALVKEMAVPLVQEFNALEREGIVVFNAFLQCKVIVVAPILRFLCDNPRGAEICSQLGATAMMYCRICTVDVSSGLQGIGHLRTKTDTVAQIQRIQSLPTKRERKQMQTQSTPVEALHTLVLGPYKYMLRSRMARFSPQQCKEVLARIASFPFSGFALRLSRDISKYNKLFVGRDFKTLAQLALFVFPPLVSPGETEVWLALSKVESMKSVCLGFAQAVDKHCPELRSKLKIHLLLHLPDHMLQFGPPSGFNTERCESYNGVIRSHNIYANKHAPSKDIANSFAIQESIRFFCSGGHLDQSEMQCGDGVIKLYQSSEVEDFLTGTPSTCDKAIYCHGALRKISVRRPTQLGSELLQIQELGEMSIATLIDEHVDYRLLLPPTINLQTLVTWGKVTVTA